MYIYLEGRGKPRKNAAFVKQEVLHETEPTLGPNLDEYNRGLKSKCVSGGSNFRFFHVSN